MWKSRDEAYGEREKASIDQWMEMCASTIDIPVAVLTFSKRNLCTKEEALKLSKAEGSAKMVLLRTPGVFRHLDLHLRDHTFLVGERLSLADISVALSLRPLFFPRTLLLHKNGIEILYPHFWRWLRHILHQPACVRVYGKSTA